MTAIVDYGVGNLFSLYSSLKMVGENVIVTSSEEELKSADRIILPGVGAFGDAALKLRETGLDKVVIEEAQKGKPLMGICLGMQLLFDKGFEYGEHNGLSLIKGNVVPMKGYIDDNLQVPHIGWNALIFKNNENGIHPIFKYINEGDCVYFVHSYYATDCNENLIATAEYSKELTAAVANGNIIGCQFHPEKSGEVGMNILKAFCELS
ncbi:MAG: imidazole glycerol phosphate synthase subunit HisH [Oscillospiraceae bacterium]|nr:imidazole glycerol phosphate synthase subunit HisH [Oscillospiraceae bacterium]